MVAVAAGSRSSQGHPAPTRKHSLASDGFRVAQAAAGIIEMNDSGGLQVSLAPPCGWAEIVRCAPPTLVIAREGLPASGNPSGQERVDDVSLGLPPTLPGRLWSPEARAQMKMILMSYFKKVLGAGWGKKKKKSLF